MIKNVGIILLFLLSQACSITKKIGKPNDGWICFENSKDIWVMRTDGGQLQNLTSTESIWESAPKLSRDGSKILYVDMDGNLYVINRNGTNRQVLMNDGSVREPSWSPDGNKIVYNKIEVNDDDAIVMSIHIFNVESNVESTIYEVESNVIVSPTMSPDGNTIVFTSSSGVYTIGVDGNNFLKILDQLPDLLISNFAWSGDGQKIAFHATNGVPYGAESWVEYIDIYTMNYDGTDLQNLTNNAPDPSKIFNSGKTILKMSSNPCWGNGEKIVFCFNENPGDYSCKPYIMNSDGSSLELLVDQVVADIDYQPDS